MPALHIGAGVQRFPQGSRLVAGGTRDAGFVDMDDYDVGELLGRGGMGEIRIARHTSGRIVAIKKVRKTLSLDRTVCQRLTHEAQMLRLVDHPNVVSALDIGTDVDGQPYLVMSRAFGTPLDAVIAQVGAFSRNRISAIASQLFSGLIAIHEAAVVHGDLKASNILLDEIDRITIIDFGLARSAPCAPSNDAVCGTPAYMAPELFGGSPPSVAADIFAVGVIMYELLTGSPPLAAHLPPLLMWSLRVHEPAELASLHAPDRSISTELDNVLVCALARDPDDRFATVRELADALAVALAAWEPIHPEVTGVYQLGGPTRANLAPTKAALLFSPGPGTLVQARSRDRVITDALEGAAERMGGRDVGGAVKELEDALEQLLAATPEATPAEVGTEWRVETVLAALYHSIGKKEHGSRMARMAQQHALSTRCPVAKERTDALIARLGLGRTRIARGSRQAPLR
jgi:tRNA A-37 threonylcarbamoyl transferase component Bud32